ncbi:MAG: ATP-binding protein [Burkholderiaceae bacterium]
MIRVTSFPKMPRLPRYWPIVAVFVAMTILQASVAAVSIQLLSTVRAYVAGESLYSKAQKDAQINLLDYAEKHQELDYARFESSLAVPLGDRAAREALQRAAPDIEAARQGFLDGGNHPDDIEGLIRMFRWFQHVPFMSRTIATWTEGDRMIEEMRTLVERAHERLRAGDADAPAVAAMLQQSQALNERLTQLTSEFSAELGEASRATQRLLLGLNTGIAVLLTISGLVFVRRAIRMQAAADLRMERLIHAVSEGVITVDERRRIVLFNEAAEAMFGVASGEALGQPIDRFVEQIAIAGGTAAAPSSFAATGTLQALTGRKRDGRPFPLEASMSRLQMDQGVLTTIVLRDITTRIVADAERRAHEALEASSKAKTDFLSRMSHELRTPLNAVIGFSKLLRLDAVKPLSAEQLERVQHVENAGSHLLALVNDVLDLSRIESGEMSVSSQAVQLARVIEEAATMVSPLVTKAGVEVFVASESPPPGAGRRDARLVAPDDTWVNADPVRLRQVLVNLLSNAVKYNRPGGRVALTWRRMDDACEILVTDTGQGIPAEQLACLFQPFNRLGAESSAVEGTGIGLVLSRQLAEMMGGTLTISSTFGVGTCASLRLGLAAAPAAKPAPARLGRAEAHAAPTLTVLYAEDDEVNAELVRQLVTMRQGVSLRVATSGAMALECARADPPDLMLVDMNLGDMTGIELARELRRDRATRDVCLVALSADALPEQIRAAMACGFESYLTKPINFDEVLAVFDAHSQEAFV